ncbi:hypothetical protein Pfo_006294 [Paulownia fortunei]|nr:hypothetical protein Pfo_006294 [Paulownia fortunei]
MIPSNPKIIYIICPIEKAIIPCSSPVFAPSPHISTKQNMFTTSSVCQGLQSCLEPLLFEPRVLMHQLAPSKPGLSFPGPQKQTEIPRAENSKNCPIEKMCESNRNGEESVGSCNFMQSLTNTSYNCRQLTDEPEQVYVHPLVKRSTSSLSTRSLEMCTESLGSETGSGIDSSIDGFSYHVSERQSSGRIKQPKTRELAKKVKHISSFPPPLTSISGSDGVQVQTHREGGRLVIKAFSFSSCSTYFQTERENGRLRLSLLKDGYRDGDQELVENEEEGEEENGNESEKDCDESDDETDFNGLFWGENLRDDGGKVGCKIGGGEWSSSRCNGDRSSRKRLPSLPFCVAIS